MFNLFSQRARSVHTPLVLIGDIDGWDLDAETLDDDWGRREHELWLAEQAQIRAEWDAMSDEERSDIYCAFLRAWNANNPTAGEGRYGLICMRMLPLKGLD